MKDEGTSGRFDATLIIPTFREIGFALALDRLLDYLSTNSLGRTEILVVDDSDDETRKALARDVEARRSRVRDLELRLIDGRRLGKGAAVRDGALAARGDVVFVIDADLLIPLENIGKFARAIADGADIVIGERSGDRYRDSRLRHYVSRALYFIQLVFVFHSQRFEDTQCGFKAFRGDVLKELARLQIIDGGIYDVEYLYAATLKNKTIVRMHVELKPETRPSRIDVWRCMRVDTIDIARFKLRGLRGHYR